MTWIENKTGEFIAFTNKGWMIVMQAADGRWYWSHGGKPQFWFDTSDAAKASAERWAALAGLRDILP